MQRRTALLVVDVQLDFCPGGALPVPLGDHVVPVLNRYLLLFVRRGAPIFASRDWHPADSEHFREYGGSWPTHCVQETAGARFHTELMLPDSAIVISKGIKRWDDGLSPLQGVTENGTPLAMLLKRMNLDRLFVGGLATDYCVKLAVLEARREGFGVTLLSDAIRGLDIKQGDSSRAIAEMVEAGADLATLDSIGSWLAENGGG